MFVAVTVATKAKVYYGYGGYGNYYGQYGGHYGKGYGYGHGYGGKNRLDSPISSVTYCRLTRLLQYMPIIVPKYGYAKGYVPAYHNEYDGYGYY